MKQAKHLLLTTVFSLGLASTAVAGEVQMTVKGITCGHCESAIEKEVGKLPHVKSVKADHQKGLVKIVTDNDKKLPAQADLEKAVKEAGFTAVETKYN